MRHQMSKTTVSLHSGLRLSSSARYASLRASTPAAVRQGRGKKTTQLHGERLIHDLIDIADRRNLTPRSEDVDLATQFPDPVDFLDPVIEQYLTVLRRSDLKTVHLRTMLCMAVRVAEQNNLTDRLLIEHRRFLKQLLGKVSFQGTDRTHLVNILWDLGQLGPAVQTCDLGEEQSGKDLLEEAVHFFESCLENCTEQEVVKVIVSFVRLECPSAVALFSQVVSLCRSRRDRFKTRDLCRLAWAMGKLNAPDADSFLQSLAGTIQQRRSSVTPQELSQFIWACGQLKSRIPSEAMDALMLKIEANVRMLAPEDLTNVLWALTRISFRPRFEFLDMVEVYATDKIAAFKSSEITAVLHALAIFSYSPPALLEVSKASILDYRERFTLKELCGAAWSLAVLDALDREFLKLVITKFQTVNQKPFRSANGSIYVHPSLDTEDLLRLHLCLLHLRILQKQEVADLLPDGLEQLCLRSLNAFQHFDSTDSIISHVLHNFEYMGYDLRSPYYDLDTGWMLNCVRNANDVQIVVDVVREAHCFVNEKHRLQGTEKWRHRVLRECGWPLLVIYEDVWMAMDFQGQADYLADNVLPLIN